jgi:hypothetical protein
MTMGTWKNDYAPTWRKICKAFNHCYFFPGRVVNEGQKIHDAGTYWRRANSDDKTGLGWGTL